MIARRQRPVSPTLWIVGPMAAVVTASLLLSIPLRVAGFQLPEPVFALVPAFVWAIVRPSVWPPIALGVLGLCLDLIWGTPTGLWAVCLLVAFALVFFSRRTLVGQDVWVLWLAYGAACGAAFVVGIVLCWLRTGQPPGLIGVGLQFAVTLVLFPFAWRLVERHESADTRY
jgi:rod shape-determining protein MreD